MWCKIIQHRLVFLVGVLVTAALLALLVQARIGVVSGICAVVVFLLVLGLFVASLAALKVRHPATFLVRDGTFTTPPHANTVLMTAALTIMPIADAGFTSAEVHSGFGLDRILKVGLALMLLLLPLLWYRLLGPFGPSLRPEGVLDRQLFGSIFVPWEAGPAAQPTSSGVKLRIAHPELVVRRGWRPGTTILAGADRGFTAWAINLYATRPEYRPAIGTDEGLLLLQPR